MTQILGTCSICGGPVTVPLVWHGVVPPTPRCATCGAVPQQAHGPIVPMQPGPHIVTGPNSGSGTQGGES